jgi:hypothetical protein
MLHCDLFNSESIRCEAPFHVFVQDGPEWKLGVPNYDDLQRF